MTNDQSEKGTNLFPMEKNPLGLEEGDMFPYRGVSKEVTYGKISEVDVSRSFPFKVENSLGGHSWLSMAHYCEDAPEKPIVSRYTAADLYWRVDRHDGR